jgi:hypothetical protein
MKQERTCSLSSHSGKNRDLATVWWNTTPCTFMDKCFITKLHGVTYRNTTDFLFLLYFTTPSATRTNKVTNKLTPRKNIPRKAKCFSARQEIPCMLMNTNVHYRVHNSPSSMSIVNHMNPIYALSHCLRSILILSLHRHLRVPTGLFSSDFSTKNL